ncbi:MAG: UbiA family prenyltransferase [Methanolobus sp.]|uniref:UbiA family prenyltransferase n=1 Tax=Methanolobus sp. TaxID=1874737 RepID=UPI00272FA0D8|nr:UbiA family prenyltransferase [Methanolobus sp.]MDP2217181.1 UbiA family prenyltransferase [Methanolobus sp.]
MALKDYLQLARAHTAPATIITMLVAYHVGGGRVFSCFGLLIGVYALLIHWLSYGHNSLIDFKTGYDSKDKNKQHFPLVSGRITIAQADRVIHWGLLIFSIFGAAISYYYAANPVLSISGLLLFYSAGHAYNDGLGKTSILKSIPLTLCYLGLWLWVYFMSASTFTYLGGLVMVYMGLTILYQIAYEGELKDLEADEANLLRYLGAKVEKGFLYPGKAALLSSFKLAGIAVLLLINMKFYVFAGAMVMFYLVYLLTVQRVWNHGKELTRVAVMEIITIYMLVIAVMPWREAVTLMTFGIVYYISMNKFMWRTLLRPQV